MSPAPVPPSLEALAHTALAEHKLTMSHVTAALEHAIRCGEALVLARQQIEPGGWYHWVDQLGLSRSAVQNYVRLATYRAELARLPGQQLTIHGAIKQLRMMDLPNAGSMGGHNRRDVPAEALSRAEAMRAEGQSYEAIGKALGVNRQLVQRRLDPNFAGREQAAVKKHRQRTTARKRAESRAERDALMAGAPVEARTVYEAAWALADLLPRAQLSTRTAAQARNVVRRITEELLSQAESEAA